MPNEIKIAQLPLTRNEASMLSKAAGIGSAFLAKDAQALVTFAAAVRLSEWDWDEWNKLQDKLDLLWGATWPEARRMNIESSHIDGAIIDTKVDLS